MVEKKIQETLNNLHGTHDFVSKKFWNMEDKYSMEDIEKIQRGISNIKCSFLKFLYDRCYLINLVGLYHGINSKIIEYHDNHSNGLQSTKNALQNIYSVD